MPWWNESKIKELEHSINDHIDYCNECQAAIEQESDDCEYCPEGEKLLDVYLEADLEYSWQHDFDGYGSLKAKAYNILCPCNNCFVKTMEASFNSTIT